LFNYISFTALLSATALNYLLSLVAIILFFVYYTHPASCSENKAFISVNMLLCIGASVMSILPKIQESQPRCGLLQSSVITVYTMYLTWSAMTNEPETNCNPSLLSIIGFNTTSTIPKEGQSVQWWHAQGIIGLILFLLCVFYSRYEPSREMKSQWTAVWVKISSSWIGIVLYVWTLVAPLVLTNRDFD
jgi:hypothetical protein